MSYLSEHELRRRDERIQLQQMGIDPYPAATFDINTSAEDINKNYERNKLDYKDVQIAGRIMSRRIMGNASFFEIQDATGRLQCYVRRDDICPDEDKTLYNTVFKKLLDLGDIVGLHGYVFTTQTGEITLHVTNFVLLTKSLKPLPIVKETEDEQGNKHVHDAFTDPELRYRQRYVDLIVNPQVREAFKLRTAMIQGMRQFMNDKGFLEVETPVLQPQYGGAAARPFVTHHNTLDMKLYLRIANELYLKRLIVGGFNAVYEFAKDFRNEGMSRFHNPEFTMVELYAAYKDYKWMMDFMEEMLETVAQSMYKTTQLTVGDKVIDFARPWKRYTMFGAIQEFTGIDISNMDEDGLRTACAQLGIDTDPSMGKGKLIDEIFGAKVEPFLIQPTFITDYPVEMSPLAKRKADNPALVERFEAICNGKEICNAFSELNDPIDQRARFEEQAELGRRGDPEAMGVDEDFLRALEYGMPPTAGLGIGIDRLAMIMTNQPSIQDVIFFPQMRAEVHVAPPTEAELLALGIPNGLLPAFQAMRIPSMEALKAMNPAKLMNDLGGLRKKLKLEVSMPTADEIAGWLAS